jgi:hypothetical protein
MRDAQRRVSADAGGFRSGKILEMIPANEVSANALPSGPVGPEVDL